MLRWLKDKKKSNKKSRPDTPDDYGFKQQRLHPPTQQTGLEDGYDDKTYHIYEEIPDIPTPVPDADFPNESFPEGGFQQDSHHHHHDAHHHDNLHHHHHSHPHSNHPPHPHHQRPSDGPYMVVPIVGSHTQEASSLQQSGLESRSAFSLVEGEGRTAFTCAVIGRRRSSDQESVAVTSSEPYTTTTSGCYSDGGGCGRGGSISDGGADCAGGPCSAQAQNPPKLPARPWETKMQSSSTSFSSSSGVLSSTSTSSIGTASSSSSSSAGGHFGFGFGSSAVEGGSGVCQVGFLKRPVALPAASAESCQASTRSDRKCCGGGSGCCCSSSPSSAHAHSRLDHFRDCDSSCYEYDVSTTTTATSSSESEQYDNYEVYLAKVEENLMMKHKVQKIILSMEKSRQGKKSSSSSSSSSRNKQHQQLLLHGRGGVGGRGGRSRMNDGLESDEDFGDGDADCCGKSPKKFHQQHQHQHQHQHRDNSRSRHAGGHSHHCCGDAADYDEGTLADQSESENSSGYYESFSPAGDGGGGCGGGVGGTVNALSPHALRPPMTESSSSLQANSRAVASCCRESSSSCCCSCEMSPRQREKSSSSSSSSSSCCRSSAPCCRCGHVATTSATAVSSSSSSRKTPFCGVRSLEMGHRREKSTDSLGKIPSPSTAAPPLPHHHHHHHHHQQQQHEDSCTRVNSCQSNSCCSGGPSSSSRTGCGEARRRSCSRERERGPPGVDKRVVGPAGPPLASSHQHQHQQHKHCHSTLKQLREFAARESAAVLAGKNSETDSYLLPTAGPEMAATTTSSSSLKASKEKNKHHDRSHHHHHHHHHSKSGHHHRKHRHSSKPRKGSKGHASAPDHHGDETNNNNNDDYEVPGSNPGEGLDTREVEEEEEDSEVYNPPPSVSDFTSRVGGVGVGGISASLQPKLSCHKAWKQDSSEIYRTRGSGTTSSSSSSSNRLLSDLIVSNYDRQLFVRV